ncbi:hypothetical protein HAQ00_10090 [Acidithiobacillus caldus ATCC 51756]|jgi:preprotein translocase subunit SecB|uniref:hypothetical protein n=1 Tax=Acidithiobacillus caldus TaxID=33059 RepID=UPI001C06B392|nr:hypothetical protein [Acidithiobacillus caldus]MBU2736063.1 hypothetical protein [Acidithiobacillus caldus ATCC 51756]MBU2801768.1 hypothetical protein [Acidithiobacillus caldus]
MRLVPATATKKLLVDCLSTHIAGRRYELRTDFQILAETNFFDAYTVLLSTRFRVIADGQDQVIGEVVTAGKWVDQNLLQLPAERIDQVNFVVVPSHLLLYTRPLVERLLSSVGYPGYPIPGQDFRVFMEQEKRKRPPIPRPIVGARQERGSECAA